MWSLWYSIQNVVNNQRGRMAMGKKRVVILRPFHEVAFEILEQGYESKISRQIENWDRFGPGVVSVVTFLLTRCVVPEKERSRIVPALVAASKKLDCDEGAEAIVFTLKHFMPGKKGLKELGELLSAEYLKCEVASKEAKGLKDLLETLELEVPERPEKEKAKKPAPKKPVGKKAGKAQAKGGGKKKQKLTK